MKKLIIMTILIIIIPYILITIFVKNENKEFHLIIKETNIKIKKNDEIIELPLEEYIIGVVASEMPASFEIEALKAQAVASRSYVLKKMEQNNNEYDILDDTLNQVYLNEEELKEKYQDNYEKMITKIKQAVNSTKGEYLTYNGEVILAFFFSTSSGYTENCEDVFVESLPYLRSVESPYEEVSPSFLLHNTISLNDFYTKLNLPYKNNLEIERTKITKTGRIKEIKINNQIFKASDIRTKLNLKSTYFEINQMGSNVEIITKGYGHGVGMSQYGANGYAKMGYTYDQILKHYYTDVEIAKINV